MKQTQSEFIEKKQTNLSKWKQILEIFQKKWKETVENMQH